MTTSAWIEPFVLLLSSMVSLMALFSSVIRMIDGGGSVAALLDQPVERVVNFRFGIERQMQPLLRTPVGRRDHSKIIAFKIEEYSNYPFRR